MIRDKKTQLNINAEKLSNNLKQLMDMCPLPNNGLINVNVYYGDNRSMQLPDDSRLN